MRVNTLTYTVKESNTLSLLGQQTSRSGFRGVHPKGLQPSLEGVSGERLSSKSQPGKMPRLRAATVTAGGHRGKAPLNLHLRLG